jgi:hypothetical protein
MLITGRATQECLICTWLARAAGAASASYEGIPIELVIKVR